MTHKTQAGLASATTSSSDAPRSEDSGELPSIAIVSINFEPELTGIAVYSTGMAEYLASRGHRVTVYTGFPYYPAWLKLDDDVGKLFSRAQRGNLSLRRSYLYVPRRPSAVRRILHEFSFTLSASINYLFSPHSDVTIIVSPPLALGLPIALLARIKRSKAVFHVQDLQPDAAVDLGMLRPGLLTRLLFALEKATYAAVDRVSTIGEAMRAKIRSKGVAPDRTLVFRNWADTDLISPSPAAPNLRAEWGLNDKFVVLYSGNMGVKQGLFSLLGVASLLREERDVVVLIVGDGGQKEELMARARAGELGNVVFMPPVAREDLPRLLATADVSVIPQRASIQDLVVPSKLGNLLCSGRPVIVAADARSEMGEILTRGECAILVPPENHTAMAAAVLELRANPQRRAELAARGLIVARATLGREAILESFADQIVQLARGGSPLAGKRARTSESTRTATTP
jgi:colanic acid biosynthesis glycosyl transferase WcaI